MGNGKSKSKKLNIAPPTGMESVEDEFFEKDVPAKPETPTEG